MKGVGCEGGGIVDPEVAAIQVWSRVTLFPSHWRPRSNIHTSGEHIVQGLTYFTLAPRGWRGYSKNPKDTEEGALQSDRQVSRELLHFPVEDDQPRGKLSEILFKKGY